MSEARLIIVDDEPVVLQLLAAVFRGEEGLRVVRCPNGTAALAAIEEGVDVLLTDKNLPGQHGLQLAARIQERHPGTRLVLVSLGEVRPTLVNL